MRGRGGCVLVEGRSPSMAAHTESLQHPLLSDGQYGITPDAFGREIATHKGGDVPPITSLKQFGKEGWIESKKLWSLAGPAIFTAICQYSLGAITQTFAGHLGTVELAAVAIENSAIGGLAFGFMLGMGSALETLCGQAYGAGQLRMLGVYMQRSWVIMSITSLVLSPLYIFATPILKLLGQADDISELAGVFSIWMLPELFGYALNFPVQKFLQSQSKVMAMAWISAIGLILHIFLSWLCILKLHWGLAGAAFTLDLSWWLIVLGQLVYAVRCCPGAWTGLSWLAFQDLWSFIRLSLASAVMLCLEFWYFMVLIILTGYLKNAEIELDSISICMNLDGWEAMIFIGFNAAISVRVSNELGAGHPRAAKFSVIIVVATSLLIGIIFMGLVLLFRNKFAVIFTDSQEVMDEVYNLAPLLAVTMLLNSVQPVLSGVAIGGGWQTLIAYVNIGCYYVVGVPIGFLLGYKFDLGAKGIWCGLSGGVGLQTLILLLITYFTNWNKEVSEARERLKLWGSSVEALKDDLAKGKDSSRSNNQLLNI